MGKLLTFDEAIEHADENADLKSVLLGNGFSIDYDPAVFRYDSLAEEAKLANLSVPKADLFKALDSTNFEVVMDKLRAGAALERLYGGDKARAKAMESDAKVVRNGLADVLADRHPANSQDLSDDEITHARTFLHNFGNIFTLSYDLLLYWLINAREYGPSVPRTDGFEWPTYKDKSFLMWKSAPTRRQRIFFLHGALHMFVEDRRLRKLSFNDHGLLIESLRDRLKNDEYPLIVTEGTRSEKDAKIDKSAYLRTGLRRFGELEGALFIHGMSLSSNDEHIIEPLESETSDVTALYVGIHSNPRSASAQRIMDRAEDIRVHREKVKGRPVTVKFYDSKSAHVWRD